LLLAERKALHPCAAVTVGGDGRILLGAGRRR
jgi:hypothetical protein